MSRSQIGLSARGAEAPLSPALAVTQLNQLFRCCRGLPWPRSRQRPASDFRSYPSPWARVTGRPLRASGPPSLRPMRCLPWPPLSAHPVRITGPGPTPPGPGSDPAASAGGPCVVREIGSRSDFKPGRQRLTGSPAAAPAATRPRPCTARPGARDVKGAEMAELRDLPGPPSRRAVPRPGRGAGGEAGQPRQPPSPC